MKRYACIVADPPWKFRVRDPVTGHAKSPERHYRTAPNDWIAKLPVDKLAAPNAFLFLWITGPMLTEGAHIPIMQAWGFKPSSIGFVWIKAQRGVTGRDFPFLDRFLSFGMGYTTRQNAEFVVIGRRGSPKRLSGGVRQVVISDIQEHSRKPEEVQNRIEKLCAGPRLEMFARRPRPGWDVWGNETTKFGGTSEPESKGQSDRYRGAREEAAHGRRAG